MIFQVFWVRIPVVSKIKLTNSVKHDEKVCLDQIQYSLTACQTYHSKVFLNTVHSFEKCKNPSNQSEVTINLPKKSIEVNIFKNFGHNLEIHVFKKLASCLRRVTPPKGAHLSGFVHPILSLQVSLLGYLHINFGNTNLDIPKFDLW